jgi:Amidohydrolase ring-opening protein (Amido_AtzD_TrzD)
VRGWRHIMLDDTDISATRHARAAVGGLIAGLTGCPAVFVSGGAEHQGPPGGGPVAVIAKVWSGASFRGARQREPGIQPSSQESEFRVPSGRGPGMTKSHKKAGTAWVPAR